MSTVMRLKSARRLLITAPIRRVFELRAAKAVQSGEPEKCTIYRQGGAVERGLSSCLSPRKYFRKSNGKFIGRGSYFLPITKIL